MGPTIPLHCPRLSDGTQSSANCYRLSTIRYPPATQIYQRKGISVQVSNTTATSPASFQLLSWVMIPVVLYSISIISASAGEKLEHDSTSPLLCKQDTHSHCALLNECAPFRVTESLTVTVVDSWLAEFNGAIDSSEKGCRTVLPKETS
jgi:hypothetical protein